MRFHFDTDDKHAATAALLVYAVYRSRDPRRFKVTPDLWEQIGRFVKASAKRARTLPAFIDALMPRLACGALRPRWLEVGYRGLTALQNRAGQTEYVQAGDSREFLTGVLERADHAAALRLLYQETAWIILLVRDRLEREKQFENLLADDEGESI